MELQMDYYDINLKKLEVMRKEADACFKRGDDEDGVALLNQIVDINIPIVEQELEESPELLPLLHIEAMQGGIEGTCAEIILKRLALKGIT
tara:strand:+ start:111 stop:383 length:273 start_codon:yes stop_codon:yes gene_type:complete